MVVMNNLSIASKIFGIVLVTILIITFILTTQAVKTIQTMAHEDIQRYEYQIIDEKKKAVKNYVDFAKDVLKLYKDKVTPNTTPQQLADLKKEAIKALDSLLYGDDTGYIFVYNYDGVPLAFNTRQDLVGKNLINTQGGGGKYVIRDLIKIAKETNGSFYEYQWQKRKDGPYLPKVSYAYGDRDWNWMIGTGEFLENEYKEIAYKKEQILKHTKDLINTILLSAFTLTVIAALIFLVLIKKIINKPLQNLKNGLDDFFFFLRNKNKTISPIKILSKDEIGDMSKSINENISVSAQLHQKIEEEKLRFQLAIEGSNEGLFDWDVFNDTIYFSSRWKSMLGYKDSEINHDFDDWSSKVHPDDLGQALKDIEDHLEGKTEIYENTHRMKHKDGSWVWILARGKVSLDETGAAVRMVGSHSDVTEVTNYRNSLQEKVQEQLELIREKDHQLFEQAKIASLGGMLSNIAHQWNQPLHVISTAIANVMIQKEFDDLSSEELEEYMDLISNQVQYLSETINTFKDFLKEDEEAAEVIIEQKILSTINIIRSSFTNNSIEIKDNINYDHHTSLHLIEGKLSQVLINIFNNAQDILLERKIEKPWIQISLKDQQDKVIISIEDNGGGVEEENKDKIFEPYFTTKHQAQGTGLSLHICYKIVYENFNGKLYVNNTQNGAKFFIEIPKSEV
jgi:PAS domain S-box-containing protein